MRGLKSTIALIVVLAGLGAYIYFVTWKQADTASTSNKEKVFSSVEADKIEDLKVTSSAGDATSLKKSGGEWQIVQPIAAKADASEVNGITAALSSIEITRVVDENPTCLNDYVLSNPRVEIDFKTGRVMDYRKPLISAKSATGSDLFATRRDEQTAI